MAREWNDMLDREIDVDSDALLAAIRPTAKHPITLDSEGGGVGLYAGQRFDTWHDLAFAFGLDAADFAKLDA